MAKRKRSSNKSQSSSPQQSHYIAIVAIVAVVAVVILVMNSMQTSTPVEEVDAALADMFTEELETLNESQEEFSIKELDLLEEGSALVGEAGRRYRKSASGIPFEKISCSNYGPYTLVLTYKQYGIEKIYNLKNKICKGYQLYNYECSNGWFKKVGTETCEFGCQSTTYSATCLNSEVDFTMGCYNNKDDDNDGLMDCEDPDCQDNSDGGCEYTCNDNPEDWNSDNDGDGLFNCMDADCKGKTNFFGETCCYQQSDCPTGYTCAMGIGEDNLHVCLSTTNLADYPDYFVIDGIYNGLLVLGENAASNDTLAAIYIATSMKYNDNGVYKSVGFIDATKLDSEVNDVTAQNLISVGGECVNEVTADLLGFNMEDCSAGEYSQLSNEARIQLFKWDNGKITMLVRGSSYDMTILAAKVIAYRGDELSGAHVKITGNNYADAVIKVIN